MNWQLTSAQFMCLWEATDLDRMPYPLQHRSAAATDDAYTVQQQRLDEWRRTLADPKLLAAVSALRHPQLSVTVFAPSDHDSGVRRRGSVRGRVCVTTEQVPSHDSRGDIHIRTNTASDTEWLAHYLVRDLPDCPPGRTPSLTAHPDEVHERTKRVTVLQNAQSSDGVLLRRIVTRPRTGIGYICIRGARSGLDEPVLGELTWLDVAEDGRYLYYRDHSVHLRSAGSRTLRDEVTTRISAGVADASPRRS